MDGDRGGGGEHLFVESFKRLRTLHSHDLGPWGREWQGGSLQGHRPVVLGGHEVATGAAHRAGDRSVPFVVHVGHPRHTAVPRPAPSKRALKLPAEQKISLRIRYRSDIFSPGSRVGATRATHARDANHRVVIDFHRAALARHRARRIPKGRQWGKQAGAKAAHRGCEIGLVEVVGNIGGWF